MTRWQRFDLDLPDDFPVRELDALHAHLSDYVTDGNKLPPGWREWAGALNGLAYRFRACDEHGQLVVVSLADSSPPHPKRYEQERDLYAFYMEGLSALECFYYGLYFLGTHANPAAFPLTVKPRDVTPKRVTEIFEASYAQEQLTKTARAILDDGEFTSWSDVRNYLSHRGTPGRHHYSGGGPPSGVEWDLGARGTDPADELTPGRLTARREWLGQAVSRIAADALPFAQTHFQP